MSNLIFPSYYPGINIEVVRTRISSTVIQTMVNGEEARVANWTYPRYQWEIDFTALHNYVSGTLGDLRDLEFQDLIGFFNNLSGPWDTFGFSDQFSPDYLTRGQFIATGDGTTTVFQMYRTFGTSTEPVYLLNNIGVGIPNYGWINPIIYLGGTPYPSTSTPPAAPAGSGWSINPTTGLLTFSSHPGSGVPITADFSYMWRARLSEDSQEMAEQWPAGGGSSGTGGVWAAKSPIKIISVRQ